MLFDRRRIIAPPFLRIMENSRNPTEKSLLKIPEKAELTENKSIKKK